MKISNQRKHSTFDYTCDRVCVTCGQSFQGRYCNRCGEKVIEPYERSLSYFFHSVLNAFTFFDGKFFRSLKIILVNPGKLSKNFSEGVRQPYMQPVSLFFLSNFLYFLIPIFQSFNSSFQVQYYYQPYSPLIQRVVDERLQTTGVTFDQLASAFNAASPNNAKLLIILIVLFFSFFLMLINSKRVNFYADHLAVSFEFMSFTLLYTTLSLSLFLLLVVKAGAFIGKDWGLLMQNEILFIFPSIVITTSYFLIRLERTYYAETWPRAILKSILLFACLAISLFMFRFLLFVITWLTF